MVEINPASISLYDYDVVCGDVRRNNAYLWPVGHLTMGKLVYRIHCKEDVEKSWLVDAGKVAIIGGILVPMWTIDEVADHVREICTV